MTIYELKENVDRWVENGLGDYSLTIDGLNVDDDCITYIYYKKEIDIRPHHYKSPQYDAAQKLQDNIKKAIDSYFKEIWRKEDDIRKIR